MPKIVDHDARRLELVEVTWRVIAHRGFDGVTLRDVAAEAGFANGALKPYFPTRASLVRATFTHVFGRTNARVESSIRGLAGLDALHAFALEVLPLDEDRLDEARVVIPFWQAAIHDPDFSALNDEAMLQWRQWIKGWLAQAQNEGSLRGGVVGEVATEALLTFLLGAQVAAVLDAGYNDPAHLRAQLDQYLELLKAG
ncbi:TetR/AcrR family transcriptional regulator [Paeniglutamicibacter psychrophenolicus]|uniref:TetR/AcrR family transcriptional regulator n=1 Tax=Paeniglutamicibacter psychrophenolicus TaxID=257454 RepID=UPI00277F1103|nr:TetR/AcrR family transcriptional regulator [Paeniglutamicibacter psychrophenolicus]MDQ0095179.1 AcrR family transcriptional regulator [Paeniglutamicibacter psychrophenolicus]